ncbi:C39 family peptidase [Nocardioides sp.]|uniref:C39 family peptidase n=1 Tax=Nocardioides sp. TaxID=35761 RepID=UPI002716C2B9|nr:C39 family peptidase [Nocardioides sp.]MDO9454858.1 C39 family peptidase [Nocardioides sp.]
MLRALLAPLALVLTTPVLVAVPATAHGGGHHDPAPPASTDGFDVTLTRWDSARDFRAGRLDGLTVRGGRLELARRGLEPTTYADPHGDGTARAYEAGTWTSPVVHLGYADDEAISSWNATTPTGTWVETLFRGRHGDGTWTKWFVLGRWTSGMDFAPEDGTGGDIHRTSLDGQGDTDGTVYTDTFSARTGREPVAFQTRVRLLRPAGTRSRPTLDALTTMTSELVPDEAPPTSASTLGGRAVELAVPRYSQNIHRGEYPEFGGGGQVWCSPTSTSMAMRWWGRRHAPTADDLAGIVAPNGDPQVPYAAMRTWDFTYEGSGNWPFNAAYAHTYGLDAFVTRLRSLAEVERFVAAGIPVITSLSWDLEEMPEAGYATDGHLMVVVGFTAEGDPILNDPASSSDAAVRHVYTRENFEKVWQGSTGGVVYLYTAPGKRLPRNVPGVTPNW